MKDKNYLGEKQKSMLKVRVNPKFSSNNISCHMSKSDKKKNYFAHYERKTCRLEARQNLLLVSL